MHTCRSLFLSDIHLGTKDCQADLLLEFLERHKPEKLYLLGDIVDFWALKKRSHWPANHTQVLRQFRRMAEEGCEIVYVPGNHDGCMRGFPGLALPNVETHLEAWHVRPNGQRLRLIHGDRFDGLFCAGKLLSLIGDISYNMLLKLNRAHNAWLSFRKKPYYSLSADLKMKPEAARRVIDRFEETAVDYARSLGADGIVCGHIHRPAQRTIDGIDYLNCGDWVEHCSALVEKHNGTIQLVTVQTLPQTSAQPNMEVAA